MSNMIQLKYQDPQSGEDVEYHLQCNKPHKVFAEALEFDAIQQFEDSMRQPFAIRGALMPDAHAGYAMPIGGVVATEGVVVPAWVGYDIGCGMCAVPTSFNIEDIKANAKPIFNMIYANIPVGFNHNSRPTQWDEEMYIPRTNVLKKLYSEKGGAEQLGSLGSGNHFIEIGYDEDNLIWIIIHSGSRGIGHSTADHYMKLAQANNKRPGASHKIEWHHPFDVDSQNGKDYITDMNFCLEFALQNRKEMIKRVVRSIQKFCTGAASWENLINRNHNHAVLKDGVWIHRKGATHAEEGMMGVIPGNMRDGCFIVRGKGNDLSLCSSSHGAGRVMSRSQAKKNVILEDFEETMGEIVALIKSETIDESPFAYKNIFDVMDLQSDLVEVVEYVRPLINIKG